MKAETVMYFGMALVLLWAVTVFLPKVFKKLREIREEKELYRLTTVVITKDFGPVMVYLDDYTKELVPVDNDLQSADKYPSVILPGDLINGEAQWSTAVERLEFFLEKERRSR